MLKSPEASGNFKIKIIGSIKYTTVNKKEKKMTETEKNLAALLDRAYDLDALKENETTTENVIAEYNELSEVAQTLSLLELRVIYALRYSCKTHSLYRCLNAYCIALSELSEFQNKLYYFKRDVKEV